MELIGRDILSTLKCSYNIVVVESTNIYLRIMIGVTLLNFVA